MMSSWNCQSYYDDFGHAAMGYTEAEVLYPRIVKEQSVSELL